MWMYKCATVRERLRFFVTHCILFITIELRSRIIVEYSNTHATIWIDTRKEIYTIYWKWMQNTKILAQKKMKWKAMRRESYSPTDRLTELRAAYQKHISLYTLSNSPSPSVSYKCKRDERWYLITKMMMVRLNENGSNGKSFQMAL